MEEVSSGSVCGAVCLWVCEGKEEGGRGGVGVVRDFDGTVYVRK